MLTLAKALERAKTVYLSALEIEAAKHLTIRMRETQLKVSRKAGNYMDEVENWHWTSIRAFIRFNGDHKTNAVGKVSWNMKMMVPAVDHLKGLWKDLASKASELLETMQTDVLDHIDGLKGMLFSAIPF